MLFNSLGSNYDFRFVLKTLFAFGNINHEDNLKKLLNKKYSGEVTLLYKGREAIKLALKILNLPKGSRVGVTGFTCYAVYQAIVEADCNPIYIDIEKETLNFSIKELQKHKDLQVLIIQNTLGIPCDMENILKYCTQNKIILIEDLAHSVGTVYKNGKEAGTVGDFTALSFSQDKMIDAVSGGALVVRNKKYQNQVRSTGLSNLKLSSELRDRFYPLFTFLIRETYAIGFGKILHRLFKKAGLLSLAMPKGGIHFQKLPSWYSFLIHYRFVNFGKVLSHKKAIVEVYRRKLKTEMNSPMRFSILVSQREKLIGHLKAHGIFVSDIWYDAPVAPRKYLGLTNYKKGECKVAEEVSEEIVNLPTHIGVTAEAAEEICDIINAWQTTK